VPRYTNECLRNGEVAAALLDGYIPSPTCNEQPSSGCLITLLVSTTCTAMPFDAPAAYATGTWYRGGGGGKLTAPVVSAKNVWSALIMAIDFRSPMLLHIYHFPIIIWFILRFEIPSIFFFNLIHSFHN
jgi:hypothetical protein